MTILSYLASLLRADLWYIFYGRWSMMGKIMATSFIISLISIVIAVGSRSGSNEGGQMSKEEVKIIIYQQGKKTVLDPQSPHFVELQRECEELLTSTDGILREGVTSYTIFNIKENENI